MCVCFIWGTQNVLFCTSLWANYYVCLSLPLPNIHMQVNAESPDLARFPLFARAKGLQCTLQPGQALYIPTGCWHYVRALDASFSVSFWWHWRYIQHWLWKGFMHVCACAVPPWTAVHMDRATLHCMCVWGCWLWHKCTFACTRVLHRVMHLYVRIAVVLKHYVPLKAHICSLNKALYVDTW